MSKYTGLTRSQLIKRLMAIELKMDSSVTRSARAGRESRKTRAALRDSEARMRAVLDTAVEGIITIDERGIIESVNPAAERIFGYAAPELVGKNVSVLMPAPYRQEHDGYLSNYRNTGHARIIGIGREVVGQRKDGSVFPMDLSVGEMRLGAGRMFTGIVRDITERRRLEKEILEISDREQRRIGQDLHDGLGQHLAGIELMIEVLQQKLSAKSKREAAQADEITRHVREAISQAKSLARGISPVVTDARGLMSALEEMASRTGKMFRIKCEFQCPKPVLIPDHAVATHLYRIAQEAVSNGIKHGRAKRVEIRLRQVKKRILLAVKDHGVGICPLSEGNMGTGLRIMNYRAHMIGGSLSVQRDIGGGTIMVCSVHEHDIEDIPAS